MKKQILFIAVMFSAILFSCSKEKIETLEPSKATVTVDPNANKVNLSGANLNKGLEAWYRFDNSLIEATGKLAALGLNYPGADLYTEDRNGVANRAIKFNGRYLGTVNNVPHSPKMSVAFWAKYDDPAAPASNFVSSVSDGPRFMQAGDHYYGYNNPVGTPNIDSGPIDGHWHHLVVTTDGTFVRFYIDGSLVGSAMSPDVDPATSAYYYVGLGNVIEKCWQGAIDDLRFYSRTLSANDVVALYNL